MRHTSLTAIALAVLVAGPVFADAPMQGAQRSKGLDLLRVDGQG